MTRQVFDLDPGRQRASRISTNILPYDLKLTTGYYRVRVVTGLFGIAEGQRTAVEVTELATKTPCRNNRDKTHHSHKAYKTDCHNRMVHSCMANNQGTHTRHRILLLAPGFAVLSN